MNVKTAWFSSAILLAAAALFCGSAQAQGGPPPGDRGPGGFGHMGGPEDEMRFLGIEGGAGEKKVTGAPFSASFTSQTTQTLADGNKIEHTSTGTVARDSEGRVRRDMTVPPGPWSDNGNTPVHVVFISDPVAGANYFLKADKKTAEKFTPPPANPDRAKRDANAAQRAKDETTVSLGTQTINGVSAEGTRITRTIPAGAIGNQSAIQIVIERWYSPTLQLYVQSKRSDPRFGETTFQLTNVQNAAPAASQFQVPSDYAVTAAKGRGRRGGAPPPPQE
jgi:hypothetical protein